MTKKNIVCTILSSRNSLDDDYTFFSDGTILNEYDANTFRFNLKRTLSVEGLSKDERNRFLEKCEPKNKNELKALFDKYKEKKGA